MNNQDNRTGFMQVLDKDNANNPEYNPDGTSSATTENKPEMQISESSDANNVDKADCIQLSFHVVNVPCEEEFYMGVNAKYDAFIISIPKSFIPDELLEVVKNDKSNQWMRRYITNIAIVK